MPDSEDESKSVGLESREIYAALSNKDSLEIFNHAAEGIEASLDVLEKYDLTKKRYYSRLKELTDLGLVSKQDGFYKHTALGAMIYTSQVRNLREILLKKSSIKVLQEIKSRMNGDNELSSSLESASYEMLKDLESSLGLSNLKPVSLYRTWSELTLQLALAIENMKSELYAASRYFDFRVSEAGLRAAARGCKINIIHSARSGLSTKLQVLGNLMTHPKALKIFRNSLRYPNVSMKEAEFPYSFIVVDSLIVGLEIVNPEDPQSFFLGLRFESPSLASRLIAHFKQISKDATEEADVLGDAVERMDGKSEMKNGNEAIPTVSSL